MTAILPERMVDKSMNCRNGHDLEAHDAFVVVEYIRGRKRLSTRRCKKCLAASSARLYKRRKAAGLCGCGRVKDADKGRCNICIRTQPDKFKIWYEKSKTVGFERRRQGETNE